MGLLIYAYIIIIIIIIMFSYPYFIWTTHRIILGCHNDSPFAKMHNIYKSCFLLLNHLYLTLLEYLTYVIPYQHAGRTNV